MAFPTYTISDLAEFSGRAELSYNPHAIRTLRQAMVLFATLTHLEDWPTDPLESDLAENGVLAMADHLYLSQPYAAINANPLSSESIGSYSYSKNGQPGMQMRYPTGVSWFDLAVSRLSEVSDIDSSAITIMEDDEWITADEDGQRYMWGPMERGEGVIDGFEG